MKIVILDGYTENPGDLSWEGFEMLGELTVYDRTPPDQTLSRIGDAQIVYTNKTPLTGQTLQAAPNIKFIGVLATGYNVVDVAAAKALHIPVANIPTYGTAAVAQFTFALLLELCHHAGAHSDAVHQGEWSSQPDFCFWNYPLVELSGKTMGLVGFGRIGQAVARIAVALGMNVLAYDQYRNPALETEAIRYAELDELLAKSDVVSLHCPLTPENTGMINAGRIKKMKKGAVLINTARGPLINEADVRDALISGQLGGAGLDVVSTEPIRPENPLLQAPNCILTPHIAWAPKESRQRLMDIAVDNLKAFLMGKPQNIVNGEAHPVSGGGKALNR